MSEQAIEAQAIRGAALLSVRQIVVGLVSVIGIVTLPILLTPADFSLYGYVTTVILVGAAVGDLGLGAYLIKNKASDRDISGSLALQLSFWLTSCLVLGIIAHFFRPYGFSQLTVALLLVALLLLSLQALPTALLERRMAFQRISVLEIVQRVILITIAIVLAAVNPAEWAIPLAAAVAAIFGYPAFLIASRWRWAPKFVPGEPLFRGFSSQWWQVRIANQASYATYPLLGGLLFTAYEVGLLVWALAITSIPAYLAPMVARATFPALSRATSEQRVAIFSMLFRMLLLIGVPMIAVLVVAAEPLTDVIFGDVWSEGIPLLRLESITTLAGIALGPLIPLMFLTMDPVRLKWINVAALCSLIVLTLLLTPFLSILSISSATIITGFGTLFIFDRILRRVSGYSPIRDMLPAVVGLLLAVGIGLPIALTVESPAVGILAGLGAGLIQLAVNFALKGGVDPRLVLARLRSLSS